jgi:hypothetical protein
MLQVGGEVSVFSYAEHGGLLAEQGRQGQPVIFDRFDGSPIVVSLDTRSAVRISGIGKPLNSKA